MKFKFFSLILLLTVTNANAENMSFNNLNNNQKYPAQFKPEIIKTDNFEEDLENLIKNGYIPIKLETYLDSSIFSNYASSITKLQNNAKKLGAEIVLFSKSDHNVTSIVTDYKLSNFSEIPQTQKDFESYNSGSQTYINGSLTRSSQRSVGSIEYKVSYFYKFNSVTGIYPKDLSDDEKNKVGLMTGVKVIEISAQSPAASQIIKNDIILKIGNDNIMNVNSFVESSNNLKKGFVILEILRKGQKINKMVAIN
ncbi:PDZ domain-containing protein [Acinetobacter bereziniae]|uniref:PDZ domain-containing protein n=1 Tax=Acinetobacter bereziniae TaxID=106648 RepID=UPI0032B431D4